MHHSPTLDPFKLIPRALPLPALQALRLLMQGRHGAVAHFPKTRICPAQIWVVDRRSCQGVNSTLHKAETKGLILSHLLIQTGVYRSIY